jgi:hypothetical protein
MCQLQTKEGSMFGSALNVAVVLLVSLCCWRSAFSATDPAISGKVFDAGGKPVVDATVMVYHAGPITGYSLFCPSCYADCGKRAVTNSNGMFSFHHLNPGLWFELMVAKSGYEPKFVQKVIPEYGMRVTATLDLRPKVNDPTRVFRGQIVDTRGLPQRDAVVELVGALMNARTGASIYGTIPGLDAIAITNQTGGFEIDFTHVKQSWMPSASGPPVKILVAVEARGMAEAFGLVHAGLERPKITVTDGAIVRGRLVQNGKPIGGAEVGLIGNPRGGWGANLKMIGSPYQEIRIGTRPDGTFEIDNVPVPGNWYVYAKMESVANRGATGNAACATKRNDEVVSLADLRLKPAYHLGGRVALSDGKPIANGMRVTISSERAWDSQTAALPASGHFEFLGLAAGEYSIFASVKGYSAPMRAVSFKTKDGRVLTYMAPPPPVSIQHNIDNFVLTLRPDVSRSAKTAVASKARQR